MKVEIYLEELYNIIGTPLRDEDVDDLKGDGIKQPLKYGFIIVRDENGDGEYYYVDMYNDKGELACMDGEKCKIVDINEKGQFIEFLSTDTMSQGANPKGGTDAAQQRFAHCDGENPVHFRLSFDEAENALLDVDWKKIEAARLKLNPKAKKSREDALEQR